MCKGGGFCIYAHNGWCTNTQILDIHHPPDLEYLIIKFRPFYPPQELTAIIVTPSYISLDANTSTALDCQFFLNFISTTNHMCNKGKYSLDKAYLNIKNSYRTKELPHSVIYPYS